MKYSENSICIEVFPTTESCAAGCSHCPLSRRVDKNPSRDIHPEVLATVRALADAAHTQNSTINFIYAGHIDSLGNHFLELIERPTQVHKLRFGYDPKEKRSFHAQSLVVKQQIELLNEHAKGLALREIAGTIYPKNQFLPSKPERVFVIKTLKALKKLKGVNEKRCEFTIELHANMIPFKKYRKKFPQFQTRDTNLFNALYPNLNLFGKPTIVMQNYMIMNNLGYCFAGKLSIAGFDPKFTKVIEVKTRYITKAEFADTVKERDKQLQQAINIINESFNPDTFSPTPEGVMIMHSSLHITNPVIWISHEEFRELLATALEKKVSLPALARAILISNYEFMKEQTTTVHYMKSMKLFSELRKQQSINFK